jgi:hypothetical protein
MLVLTLCGRSRHNLIGYPRVGKVFSESNQLGHVWTLSSILAWPLNQILDLVLNLFRQNHWIPSFDGYILIIINKPFNSSFSDLFILSWCCTLYCWLFRLQHLKVVPSIFAQMILDKLKRCMTIITFCIQIFWQKSCIIAYIIFGQCIVLHHHRKIRRLTNECASCTTSGILGFLRPILLLLALQGCYFFFVVVFNHMTMMPCRNLRPHVHCSHMIEPLGAHWWLGTCDVTPLQSLLMQPY